MLTPLIFSVLYPLESTFAVSYRVVREQEAGCALTFENYEPVFWVLSKPVQLY